METSTRELTVDSLSCFFGGTQVAAAQHFGMSLSSMQRVCRRLGMRWPKTDSLKGKRAVLAKVSDAECTRVSTPAEAFVRVFPKDSGVAVDITVDSLTCMFGGTQVAAARRLGVSLWTMKKICRRLGMRWPSSDPRRKRWSAMARQDTDEGEEGGMPTRQDTDEGEQGGLPAWQEFDEEPPAEDCADYTGELCLFSVGD
jgi:hypothetical protein